MKYSSKVQQRAGPINQELNHLFSFHSFKVIDVYSFCWNVLEEQRMQMVVLSGGLFLADCLLLKLTILLLILAHGPNPQLFFCV